MVANGRLVGMHTGAGQVQAVVVVVCGCVWGGEGVAVAWACVWGGSLLVHSSR